MAQNLTVKICHFTQGHGAFDLVTFQLGATDRFSSEIVACSFMAYSLFDFRVLI